MAARVNNGARFSFVLPIPDYKPCRSVLSAQLSVSDWLPPFSFVYQGKQLRVTRFDYHEVFLNRTKAIIMCVHVEFRSAFDFVSVLITFAALGDPHTSMYFLHCSKV